nr:flippase-like domain-containing protein [candidate division Zixibacteria bacterium]
MPSFFKKKELWGILIGAALLVYCVKDIRPEDVRDLIIRVDFYYLIPALVMEFLMIITKSIRWRTIVENTRKIGIMQVLPLYSAGQVINIVMPALTGQIGRLLLFSRQASLSKTYVFSTIVLEILFDAITLLILILLLSTVFVFPAEYRSIGYIIAIATVSLFVLLYMILHYKNQIGNFGRRHVRNRWPGLYITLRKFARSFTRGIDLLRSTRYLTRTVIFSFLGWFSHIMVIYFLFKSFDFDLPFIAAVVVMVINTVALMIPITPGNAGTFEFAVVVALKTFSITKSDAVLYALALHILDLIPIFVMGLFFFRTNRMTIKEIKEEGEKEELLEEVEDDSDSIAVREEQP